MRRLPGALLAALLAAAPTGAATGAPGSGSAETDVPATTAPAGTEIGPRREDGARPPEVAFDRAPAAAEGLGILKELIRIPTFHPPGNELTLLRRVGEILGKEGIDYEIVETEPGQGALRAVLRGRGTGGGLLVLAHVDVVGVEEGSWSVDPFAAVERDGYLYGRGAIDDKGMAAAALETMLLIARSGRPLSRDFVLILEGDEESGGELGIEWIAANRPDWIRGIAFALNEGGRVNAGPDGRPLWVGVQTVEKIPFNVELTARGSAGHASMPREDNAVLRLSRALANLSVYRTRPRLTGETRMFFHGIASSYPSGMAADLAGVVDMTQEKVRTGGSFLAPKFETRLVEGPHTRAVSGDPMFNAMLRDTFSPTMLSAGMRSNVVPSEAKATINCRILPDTTPAEFVEELKRAADEEGVEWKITTDLRPTVPPSPMDGPLPEAIRTATGAIWPGVPVVPLLSTGATDSQTLRRAGIPAYGLLPFPLPIEDIERMHGNDERIPVSAFGEGLELLYRTVLGAVE